MAHFFRKVKRTIGHGIGGFAKSAFHGGMKSAGNVAGAALGAYAARMAVAALI